MAKGDVLNLSLSVAERENLEKIAIAFGQMRGSSPNLTGLVRAIATGKLTVNFAEDSSKLKQASRLKHTVKRIVKELQAIESVL